MRYFAIVVATGLLSAACAEDVVPGGPDSTQTGDATLANDAAADTTSVRDTAVVDASPEVLDTSPEVLDSLADTTEVTPDTVQDIVDIAETDTSNPDDTVEGPPDPAATGPYEVTREDVTVAGFAAVLFLPTSESPTPAIVLAPGFQLDGGAFELYGEHLASHGIATLIPTFGDSIFAPLAHSALADAIVEMVEWLATDPRLDAARLGTAGHSRGGKLAILATTRSSAIHAVFGLDPVDTPGGPGAQPSADNPSVTPELMDAIVVPFAVLGSAYGGTPTSTFAPACAPSADNYQQYALAATNAPFAYEWLAPASGHNDFADPLPFLVSLACKAGDNPAATRALAKARLVAFFKRHLEGDLRYTLP